MTNTTHLVVYDLGQADGQAGFDSRLARLRQTASISSEQGQAVAAIVSDVAEHGDKAVVRYMQQWTDPAFDAARIAVRPEALDAALDVLDSDLRGAIERSIANVRAYQQHVMPASLAPMTLGDAQLGLRWTPVDSAGLCVPGGTAVLFSTLIMLAVPALVAGVPADQIAVVSPPPTRQAGEPAGDISPLVLATCKLLGIERVYRIGGAQAVAALAYGTETVEPIDLIAGPGNVYVQLAKALVAGTTGTDNGFYGPSEIVTVADDTANPDRVASDLLAQAEHNPGKCFLVAWQRDVIDAIAGSLEKQLADLPRRDVIAKSLASDSCAVLARDADHALELANTLATEHLDLAVADPGDWLTRVRHAGEVFLGDATPVAAGDYYAGPSHCLPTGTTGRFTSGVSAYTFLKRTGTVAYPDGMSAQTINDIAMLANAEGLDAHARSAQIRADASSR